MTRHTADVFICSWNPLRDLICTGSGDSTARIWDLTGPMDTPVKKIEDSSIVLKHCVSTEEAHVNKDVTAIDWNMDGKILATGCYDGHARVWEPEGGRLLGTLSAHKGPVFALKWNENGNYILTAGVDKSTIIWDSKQSKTLQQFTFHTQSVLDVDWVGPDTFASCSTDMKIFLCQYNVERPLYTFEGHTNEVNAIRYDKHSGRLASCSDDRTVKIWKIGQPFPLMNVHAHEKEIYTIRWSPVGYQLATASFDHTVKVWDVREEKCIHHLGQHQQPVYSVSFSPNGKYIASGSFDNCIYLWDINTGKVALSYNGSGESGGIFEVNWSPNGESLAACTSEGSVSWQ